MATRSRSNEYIFKAPGWAGGANLRDALNAIGLNEGRIMENGVLDERGGFAKRLGCQNYGSFGVVTDRILSQYVFYRGDTSPPQLIIQTSAGALLYTSNPTANPIAWSTMATGLSGSAPMSFETFRGKCYMSNGVDNYAKWDGTTYTQLPTAPKGAFLRLWKDTMWMAGIPGLADRVYSSAAGDAESWPAAGWVDIGIGDGDRMMALGSDGLYLILFKRHRHMVIYDPVTYANRVVDYEKGAESHASVIQFETNVYFLSRRGVCRYLGDTPAMIISGNLDPLFDPNILNLNALSTAWAYTVGNRVCWCLPEVGKTVPSLQIEYYPRLGSVNQFGSQGIGPWMFHRMPISTVSRWRSGEVEYTFGGHNAANRILRLYAPVGTDDGVAFKAMLETAAFEFNEPVKFKYIRYIRLLGRGKFTVVLKRNFKTPVVRTFTVDMGSGHDVWGDEYWGDGSWGPDSIFQEKRLMPDLYARQLSIIFTDSEIGTGRRPYEVGSLEYIVTDGEWAVYGTTIEGAVVGVRDLGVL